MSTAVFATGSPDVAPTYELSGWWRRVGAALVDGTVIGIGALLLVVAITAPFSLGFFASADAGAASLVAGVLVALLCVTIAALLYAPAMMARTNGRTLGRMATGIRVVYADGRPMTFGRAATRELAIKLLGFGVAASVTGGAANLVDVLWPLWDAEHRALHDMVAGTRVVLDR